MISLLLLMLELPVLVMDRELAWWSICFCAASAVGAISRGGGMLVEVFCFFLGGRCC